jgi:F5/8 type C domain-containing protein/glycosyl hydrolase family 2
MCKTKTLFLHSLSLLILLPVLGCQGSARNQVVIDLGGQWLFELDPEDVGIRDKWQSEVLHNFIRLPGSVTGNGYGDEVTTETDWIGGIVDRSWFTDPKYAKYRQPGNIKIPFWLTPLKHYKGPAWYRKDVTIPESWQGKQITLFLERCHWETRVWVDEHSAGSRNSLSTPHEYDLSQWFTPGRHTITIRVDNNMILNVGPNSHSVSDHTQTNWNGIIGRMMLQAFDPVGIDDLQVYPSVRTQSVRVRVTLNNTTETPKTGKLTLRAAPVSTVPSAQISIPEIISKKQIKFEIDIKNKTLELDLPMGNKVRLWDEFSRNLYSITAAISGEGFAGTKIVEFGMREFKAEGTQLTINGRKTFLRGTLECAIFPLTGYPPTDVESWERILLVAKAHGLNHLRFHSWCPPEAAFAAADRVGIYFHVECASWANQGSSLGDGKPVDQYIYDEGDRILKAYGNHPSFCMLAYGNEPAGKNQKSYLGKLINNWKAKDNRRVYTSGAGWPIIPENEYNSTPGPRGHQWGAGLKSRYNAMPYATNYDYHDAVTSYSVPVVSHEIGQWCVYPNFQEIAKYTGVLRARNFEIFRDSLTEHQMLDQAEDFLKASGTLQAILYKEEIEAALRTPGFGGFQLLDLHDFSGQGTALVGVLDAFWQEKGYIQPEEYHQFCCETVPLVRMGKCIWTSDETFQAEVEIAHFGQVPLKNVLPMWTLEYPDGRQAATGILAKQDIPIANGTKLGSIQFELKRVNAPAQLKLNVYLKGTSYRNHWDIWVYPSESEVSVPDSILVTDSIGQKTLSALDSGKKVLFLPSPALVDSDIPAGFTTIFWNTQWTGRQPPHTLGILCDPKHPALEKFPTEFHSNWQWWDLVTKSKFMLLDSFAPDFRPLVQVIDDWNTNRKLGLIFEAKVGSGKLLVCSIDLKTDLAKRPVAQQMYRSLLQYMDSDQFRPESEIDIKLIQGLLKKPSVLQSLGAKVIYTDSEASGHEASNAIDDNPDTIWHTSWEASPTDYPHEIQIDLQRDVEILGFKYLPRQDMQNGWISNYEIYVSNNTRKWGDPVCRGTFAQDKQLKKVLLSLPAKGRYIRFVATKGIRQQKFASLAEFDIVCPSP